MERPVARSSGARSWPPPLIGLLCLLMGGVMILLVRWWFRTGLVDDALIFARYARNFARGELAFNPGERVEGYTSFTWVALPSLGARLGLPPDRGVLWLSILFGCLGPALAGWMTARLAPPRQAVLAGVTLLLLPAWTFWAGSGMDAAGFAVLWTGSLLAYVEARSPRTALAAGAVAAATALTRPEGALLLLAFGAHELLGKRNGRRFLVSAAAFVLLFGAYFAWRWSYFGFPLPNTWYAKVGGVSGTLLLRGLRYLGGWLLRLSPFLAAAVLVARRASPPRSGEPGTEVGTIASMRRIASMRSIAAMDGILLIGAALYAAFGIVLAGGDHFPLDRFGVALLPSLVLLAWVSPDWTRAPGRKAAALLAGAFLSVAASSGEMPRFFTETDLAKTWRVMGRRLGDALPPGGSVAAYFVGAIGYDSDRTVHDMLGITNAHIAHEARTLGGGYAGHEKFDNGYILSLRPDVILLHYELFPSPDEPADAGARLWGAAARDMYARADFRQDYRFAALPADGGFIPLYRRIR